MNLTAANAKKYLLYDIANILSHAALPVPAPPTNLQVTFINSTSVTISWQAPPPDPTITIASYRLVVSETQFGLNDTVASSTTTSYTFTGLEEHNNYICSVVAVSTDGSVSNETVISFTTSQGGTDCLFIQLEYLSPRVCTHCEVKCTLSVSHVFCCQRVCCCVFLHSDC